MTRRLLLNPDTGTHHIHRNCRGLLGVDPERLVVVVVPWNQMPSVKLCAFCVGAYGGRR